MVVLRAVVDGELDLDDREEALLICAGLEADAVQAGHDETGPAWSVRSRPSSSVIPAPMRCQTP